MSELSQKGLPPQSDVEEALHRYLLQHPSGVETALVYRELGRHMNLTNDQLTACRDSDGRNLRENLVRYAHRRLKDHGRVNDGPRGLWSAKGIK